MTPGRGLALTMAVSAGLLVLLALSVPGSAARLQIDGAAGQVWTLPVGLPALLEVCGDADDYDEIVYGTDEDDRLVVGNGRSILVGGAGNDVLTGGNQDDCLLGGDGDDVLVGGNGRDVLWGGRGDDLLDGGTGKDVFVGGSGDDVCVTAGAPDRTEGCAVREQTGKPTDGGRDQKSGNTTHEPGDRGAAGGGTTANGVVEGDSGRAPGARGEGPGSGTTRTPGAGGDGRGPVAPPSATAPPAVDRPDDDDVTAPEGSGSGPPPPTVEQTPASDQSAPATP